MTITLELPPEAEASLIAQAEARGLSLDAFLRAIIKTQAAAVESAKSAQALPHAGEDPDRVIDDLFDAVQVPPGRMEIRGLRWRPPPAVSTGV